MGVKESLGENKRFLLSAFALLFVLIFIVLVMNSGLYNQSVTPLSSKKTYFEPNLVLEEIFDYSIVISTEYGDIYIDLYEDLAPENVNSLLFLIGERYYEGLLFHKVVRDFVVQAGDVVGDGSGDPGYTVEKENLIPFNDYDVGMANASQFFITMINSPKRNLDGNYSVVGRVTKGFAVLDSMQKVEVDDDYKPRNDIIIKSIQIQEN